MAANGSFSMEQLTPMMQQYFEIKKEYKDCILFYRLGDFYEMFYEDAITCSKELELTLTGKNCGQEERAPMCGVPYHAVESYLGKLIEKGYKVAICEQVEDPKNTRGIVKRDVIRVVTPGTNLNTQQLDETKNNYLMSIIHTTNAYGASIVDVTTGDYYVTEFDTKRKILDEINKFKPTEIVCNHSFLISGIDLEDLRNRLHITIAALEPWYFDEDLCVKVLKEHFKVTSFEQLGLKNYTIGIVAAGAALQYLYQTQKNNLCHLTKLIPYKPNQYMVLDRFTRRNLELVETMREKQKRGSLLGVLDKTQTAMGARLLRNSLEQPFISVLTINKRLDAITELNQDAITREEIRSYLHSIYDLERLVSKVSYKSVNPRDMIALKASLSVLPFLKELLSGFQGDFLKEVNRQLDTLEDVCELIERSIVEEPPIAVKEGGIIKEGYYEEVDKLRQAKTQGKNWLAKLEAKEKEKTGIKNLKIKYNKIFGYYLEVTNSYQNLVPDSWVRRQTLANAERYITKELKELENQILGAEDRLFTLEHHLFQQIREEVASQIQRIQETAKAIANLDVVACLAFVAEENHYIKPIVKNNGIIDIKEGRHPVVEQMIDHDLFVTNDTYLDNDKNRISIITGPNMAGKSTYMRQTALIVLMSQIGSFVPAKAANIGIVDRIFTRVGASDDLASGQSTFMVEMTEVANILRNATKNSLLILDEIGRGTSTFDGLAIAWAVIEHISNPKLLGAKTLFATHYHELTELEGKLSNVNNYCIAVKEQGDNIVFLRKIVRGGADKSYGIQVAKLAGVPSRILNRAKEIVAQLSENDIIEKVKTLEVKKEHSVIKEQTKASDSLQAQLSLFDTEEDHSKDILKELKDLNLETMTPMEAFQTLYQIQTKIKECW